MSRRMSAEGFVSTKKVRKKAKKDHERLINTRNERKAVLIACEDSVSAPLYFKYIVNNLKKIHAITASSLIIVEHNHTDPYGVLQDLLSYQNYQDFDHKWIVIDRDQERTNGGGHTLNNFNKAIFEAKKFKIEVAYANPCFEIWYLLHFEYRNTAIDRDELCERLKRDYQYSKNKLFILSQEQQNKAIRNAQNLINSLNETPGLVSPANNNPSTTVHNLVVLLNDIIMP